MANTDTTFTSHLGTVLKATDKQLRIIGEIIGGKAESYAKMLCPVDMGNLRNSITHTMQDQPHAVEIIIGTTVEYGPYVELGTGRNYEKSGGKGLFEGMKPRPYIRPAIQDHLQEYRQIVQTEMQNP